MAEPRWVGNGSHALVLVVLLMTASGLIAPHWHPGWSGLGCELCHIRYLPSLHGPIATSPGIPVVAEQDWQSDGPASELENCTLTTSSRAPPASVPFTV